MSVESIPENDQPSGHVELGGGRECEDLLIADAVGLRGLMSACKVALEEGEYRGNVGDFLGIHHLSDLEKSTPQSADVLDVNLYSGHMVQGDRKSVV